MPSDLPPVFVPLARGVRQGLGQSLEAERPVVPVDCSPGRTVWPDAVVGLSVRLCQYLHLPQCVEDLPVQQLVPELSVEALRTAVLPG